MKLVVDTGALISLACSQYFDKLLKEHSLIISPFVLEELKQFGKYPDLLGTKAREILLKKVLVKIPHERVELKIEPAERDVFSLAIQEKCLAITDDVHAARIAKEKLNLVSKPSLHLLFLLYQQKKIKKADLIEDISTILSHRNWLEGALLEYALRLIEKL